MASHVIVIDASARRQHIKTTPGIYLRDILEEACKKFGRNPDQFVLSDNSRPPRTLDLSLTFRLAGLANGQRLQLVQGSRSPSVVNIALKLPEALGGQRLQDRFPSNTSIWLVLRKFEEAAAGGTSQKLNLTQRGVPSTQTGSGRLEYEQPVVKILQRELADFVSLQKTLAQLGYNSGSVLLNLDFKQSGTPMEDAVAQISKYFQTTSTETTPTATQQEQQQTSAPAGAHAAAAGQFSSVPDVNALEGSHEPGDENIPVPPGEANTAANLAQTDSVQESSASAPTDDPSQDPLTAALPVVNEPSAMDIDSQPPGSSTATGPSPGLSVYKPPTSATPLAAAQAPDESDFVPTVEHAHAHQAVLARASVNRRLASDAELAAAASARAETLSSITSVRIRVRFPDQMQVDLSAGPEETGSTLHARVKAMLRDETLGFELRYTGAKGMAVTLEREGRAGEESLIRAKGWRGAVLVTMVWSADVAPEQRKAMAAGRVLKEALVGSAVELSVPTVREEASTAAAGKKASQAQQQTKGKGAAKGDIEAKMKKFLGFGKK